MSFNPETEPEKLHEPSPLWAVHSSREDRPYMRAWARSEADANRVVGELKNSDEHAAANRYWITQLTVGEVAGLKHTGFIPKDA